MSIAAASRSRTYTLSDGQTLLDWPFPLFADADLRVVRFRGGGRTILGLGTDYTIATLPGGASASVTLAAGALAGDVVSLQGFRAPARSSAFTGFGAGALKSTPLNDEIDRLFVHIQELRRDVDRSVKRSSGDSRTGELEMPVSGSGVVAIGSDGSLVLLDPASLGSGGSGGGPIIDPLPVALGGTGSRDAAAARAALALGNLATKGAVGSAEITDASVATQDLHDGAVTAAKVASGVVTLVVEAASLAAPPSLPTTGRLWLVAAGASGAWAGQSGSLALRTDTAWTFVVPAYGWRILALAEREAYVHNGASWRLVAAVNDTLAGRIATQLSAAPFCGGLTRAAVLDGKQVVVWGTGTSGKNALANGRTTAVPEIIPFLNPPTSIVKLVSGNGRHFVMDDQGWVHSAGDGALGALGHGDTVSLTAFKRIDYFYSQGIHIRDVVVDRSNAADTPLVYFVSTANLAYSAGDGGYGQRGDGTTTPPLAITPVTDGTTAGTPPLANVDTVSIGGYPHTVAIRLTDGRLARLGANQHGQIGDGTTANATRALIHPTITSVTQALACSGNGGGNILILTTAGGMLGAGTGAFGQLAQGAGDLTNHSSFVTIGYASPIARMLGGEGYSGTRAAITTAKNLIVWGRNNHKQHGFNDVTDRSVIAVPAAPFQGAVDDAWIAGGADTETLYVRAGNQIWAAGYNAANNCCTGTAAVTDVGAFAVVSGLDAAATIAAVSIAGTATQYGPLVLYSDGRMASGGAGSSGELGWQVGALANSPVLQDVMIKGQRGGRGLQGDVGPPGLNPGYLWEFDATTTMTDPGARKVRLNNPDPYVANQLTISAFGAHAGNPDLSDWVAFWGQNAASPANRGAITVKSLTRDGVFATYQIIGAVADNTSSLTVPIAVVSAAGGAFQAAERLSIEFQRTGPSGAIGGTTGIVANCLLTSLGVSGTALRAAPIIVDGSGNISPAAGSPAISGFNVAAKDNLFTLQNSADPSKTTQFNASLIAPSTNRTIQVPDASGIMRLREGTLFTSPLDYGIDMTGVADATALFETMVNSGAAFVIMPAGKINLAGVVHFNRPVTLLGPGLDFDDDNGAGCDITTASAATTMFEINSHDVKIIGVNLASIGARYNNTLAAKAIVLGNSYRTVTNGVIAAGSLNVFTSSTAAFTVGKPEYIAVEGAGAGGLRHFALLTPTTTTSGTMNVAASTAVAAASTKIGTVYTGIEIRGCSMPWHSVGIHVQHASNFIIEGNAITSYNALVVENLLAVDKGDAIVTGNKLTGDATAGKGLWWKSGGGLRVFNNKFLGGQDGFYTDWSYGKSGGAIVVGNSFENISRYTTHVTGSGQYQLNGWTHGLNWHNGGSGGIYFDDTATVGWIVEVNFGLNTIINAAATELVRIGKSVAGASVKTNRINGYSVAGAIGIKVYAGVTLSEVEGNHAVNCPGGDVVNLAGAGCRVSTGSLLSLTATAVIAWGTGATAVTITGAANKLTFGGISAECVFDAAAGIVPIRALSSASSAYLALQNTGGTPASILIGVESGGNLGMQTAAGKGMTVAQAGGNATFVAASELRTSATTPGAAVKVVGVRETGWGAMTGTGVKTTIAAAAAGTASAAYVQAELQGALNRIAALEARMKAYDAMLVTHGLIGP